MLEKGEFLCRNFKQIEHGHSIFLYVCAVRKWFSNIYRDNSKFINWIFSSFV